MSNKDCLFYLLAAEKAAVIVLCTHRRGKMAAMFKFVTMYRKVDDELALEAFFSETHLQLAERLPGLVKSEVGRVTGKPGGQSRFHLVYELYFAREADFYEALASEPGRSLMAALTPWAKEKLITWYYADCFEETAVPKDGLTYKTTASS
ncbi:MAG: EthD family reductase [Candidatus Promineifilaceae bacterium]